ncbi:MAG: protein kinase [Verrucomicrobia bacterium]|nr:protein kinase [Verrucomicrobiota bacterium]
MPEMNREKEIFEQALDLESPEARGAFIRQACGGDEALLQRIHALLKASDTAPDFLPEGTIRVDPDQPGGGLTEGPGTVIGRYKLLEQIGEGGFGFVFMAEQLEPIKRRVALKIIKPGMDSKQVIGRFEAERQALALMDHPNIAKVFDAGATEAGRPYFVMELVKGIPITTYCDDHNLSTTDRVMLFIKVCSAVQHAHQKGIIHRDIKPSNILVTLHLIRPIQQRNQGDPVACGLSRQLLPDDRPGCRDKSDAVDCGIPCRGRQPSDSSFLGSIRQRFNAALALSVCLVLPAALLADAATNIVCNTNAAPMHFYRIVGP